MICADFQQGVLQTIATVAERARCEFAAGPRGFGWLAQHDLVAEVLVDDLLAQCRRIHLIGSIFILRPKLSDTIDPKI